MLLWPVYLSDISHNFFSVWEKVQVLVSQVHYRWGRGGTQRPVSSHEESPAHTISRICVPLPFPIYEGLKDMKIMNIWSVCLQFIISHSGRKRQTTGAQNEIFIAHPILLHSFGYIKCGVSRTYHSDMKGICYS